MTTRQGPAVGGSGRSCAGATGGTLTSRSVLPYLRGRGLLRGRFGEGETKLSELGGGVSSVVLLVETAGERLVVKQPRRQLLVKDEWFAEPGRALIEAQALQFTHHLTPAAVPALLDVDSETCILTMAAAPLAWRPWKELLLDCIVDPSVAGHLGRLLGSWHRSSGEALGKLGALSDLVVFEQLRIEPFHRTVAERHPDLAPLIANAVEALVSRPGRCFVHGDFSPKNVLVGDGRLWVIDFEVAHLGDPVFDLAFLITHLVLKSVHRPAMAVAYKQCAAKFLESYQGEAGIAFVPADESLALQVGCLVLARVDGKSPAGYLTAEEQERAWGVGLGFLRHLVHPLAPGAWPEGSFPL